MSDVRAGVGARLVESHSRDVAVVIGAELHSKFGSGRVASVSDGGYGSREPDGVTCRTAAQRREIQPSKVAAVNDHNLTGRCEHVAGVGRRHRVGTVQQPAEGVIAGAIRGGYSSRRSGQADRGSCTPGPANRAAQAEKLRRAKVKRRNVCATYCGALAGRAENESSIRWYHGI